MKQRKKALGTMNGVGGRITEIRLSKGIKQKELIAMLQTDGVDINPSSLSKLEGQTRRVTDRELRAIAKVLRVSVGALFADGD